MPMAIVDLRHAVVQERARLFPDLIENAAQLVHVDRFGEMKIKTGFLTAPDIFVGAKTSQSDAFDRLFPFRLRDHFVTAAIGQTNVAQNDIESFRSQNLERALGRIGHGNLMTKVAEQTRQGPAGIAVIFDQQNAQRFVTLVRKTRRHAAGTDLLCHDGKLELEGRTATAATTVHADLAIVKIDKML